MQCRNATFTTRKMLIAAHVTAGCLQGFSPVVKADGLGYKYRRRFGPEPPGLSPLAPAVAIQNCRGYTGPGTPEIPLAASTQTAGGNPPYRWREASAAGGDKWARKRPDGPENTHSPPVPHPHLARPPTQAHTNPIALPLLDLDRELPSHSLFRASLIPPPPSNPTSPSMSQGFPELRLTSLFLLVDRIELGGNQRDAIVLNTSQTGGDSGFSGAPPAPPIIPLHPGELVHLPSHVSVSLTLSLLPPTLTASPPAGSAGHASPSRAELIDSILDLAREETKNSDCLQCNIPIPSRLRLIAVRD